MRNIVLGIIISAFSLPVFAGGAGGKADAISATVGLISLSFMSTLESTNYYSQNQQDDAATFVATGGEIKGASLEQTISNHRQMNPGSNLSDMDIARNVLLATSSK